MPGSLVISEQNTNICLLLGLASSIVLLSLQSFGILEVLQIKHSSSMDKQRKRLMLVLEITRSNQANTKPGNIKTRNRELIPRTVRSLLPSEASGRYHIQNPGTIC